MQGTPGGLPPGVLARTDLVAALRAAGCVFAEDEAALLLGSARTPTDLAVMLERRCSGEPLEQVLGWAAFCGLQVRVAPGVFVPRRRSELLVRESRAVLPVPAVVVDLCCGSGAVAFALAGPLVEVHAVDVDPAAAACAKGNLTPVGGQVHLGDIYEPLPADLRGRVDVIVANAPYVPSDAIALMPPEARLHEPRAALDGGPDGLDVQRRVAAGALRWLAPGGHLLVETSEQQATGSVELMSRAGLLTAVSRDDELDATVVVGAAPGAAPGASG